MQTVGELDQISGEFGVEWRIKQFFSLPAEVDKFYKSPEFSLAGASWLLRIFPNGRTDNIAKSGKIINSKESIALYLRRESSGPPILLEYSLGLKTFDEKVNPEKHFTYNFEKVEGYGSFKVISRTKLLEMKSEVVPSDVLTVVCKIRYPKTTNISKKKCMDKPIKCPDCSDVSALKNWYDHKCQIGAEGDTATEKCSYCKSSLDAHEDLSSHQQKCMDKPIKCPDCSDVIALKNWYDHKCQIGAEASEKLSRDFKTIMLSGDHSDMVVKIKGEEFRLHRSILAARNHYFDTMLRNDMKEKSTGIVTIEDCDPDIFRSFIHFIYTGKVDTLSSENVCELYEVADKYQEDQLKDECLHFMMNTLSVDSFCDFFAFALRFDEKELFQKGIDLFTSKGKEIARCVKWQVFVKEYPTQASELFIKTLDHYIK